MGGQDTQWFLMDVLSWRELVTRGRYFYKFRGIDPTAHRTTLDRSHFRNKKKKNIKKREERERSDTHDRIESVVYKPDFLHVSLQDKKLTISAIASFFIFVVQIIWLLRCYKNSLIPRKNRFSTISVRNDFHDIDCCKNCSFYFHYWRNLVFKLLLSNR